MKVDGIKLLQMIKNNQIKDGSKIYCSDFPGCYYFKNGTLGFYKKFEKSSKIEFVELSLKDILENIRYAYYEIIEEKPKKIGHFGSCQNRNEKINEIIDAENYHSKLIIGNIQINNIKHFNWFQKIMWKLMFGIKIINLEKGDE